MSVCVWVCVWKWVCDHAHVFHLQPKVFWKLLHFYCIRRNVTNSLKFIRFSEKKETIEKKQNIILLRNDWNEEN